MAAKHFCLTIALITAGCMHFSAANIAFAETAADQFALPAAAPGSQPQTPIALWAREQKSHIEKEIADYEATLVARERVDGKLSDVETLSIKVRHKPLSVYAKVLTPGGHQGDEAIYVEGRNDGKLLGHTTGFTGRLVGTVALDPHGATAMDGQRYAITEIGMAKICERILSYAEDDMHYAESEVKVSQGVKAGDRLCTLVETVHPKLRTNFHFFRQRIYIDAQWHLPVRYEQYDWPKLTADDNREDVKNADGAKDDKTKIVEESSNELPGELVEEYNYTHVKLNNGFTDADFDPHNPKYAFP